MKYKENTKYFLIFLNKRSFLTIRKLHKKFHPNRARNDKISFWSGWGVEQRVVKNSQKMDADHLFQYTVHL